MAQQTEVAQDCRDELRKQCGHYLSFVNNDVHREGPSEGLRWWEVHQVSACASGYIATGGAQVNRCCAGCNSQAAVTSADNFTTPVHSHWYGTCKLSDSIHISLWKITNLSARNSGLLRGRYIG